jgi:hypothetical protein
MIFTFHNRAAQVLDRYWEENRLPPFEISTSNTSAVVRGGLKEVEQAKELLRVYLEDAPTSMTTFCRLNPPQLTYCARSLMADLAFCSAEHTSC